MEGHAKLSRLEYLRAEATSEAEALLLYLDEVGPLAPSPLELATWPGFEWVLDRFVDELIPSESL